MIIWMIIRMIIQIIIRKFYYAHCVLLVKSNCVWWTSRHTAALAAAALVMHGGGLRDLYPGSRVSLCAQAHRGYPRGLENPNLGLKIRHN